MKNRILILIFSFFTFTVFSQNFEAKLIGGFTASQIDGDSYAGYDKLINIGDKLLRYGYGRVPETINIEDRRPSPLVINLTKKGDQYIVNDEQPDLIEYGDSDEH